MHKINTYQDFETAFGKEKINVQDIGLENIKQYLDFFNDPQKRIKAIHIAGTNGKGSTAAILQSLLTNHGLKVGLFTSPHLISYHERIKIDDQEIKDKELLSILSIIYQNTQKYSLDLTLFEALTVASIYYFIKKEVDIAIFEVGLGGRLDATNIVDSKIQVITDISKDHTEFLGSSNTKITQEKAGIIKNCSTVITSNENKKILNIIRKKTAEKKAKLKILSKKHIKVLKVLKNGTYFTINKPNFKQKDLITNLIGRHQARNASLAIVSCKLAIEEYLPKTKFSFQKIRKGLQTVVWPGRFEVIQQKNPLIIIDGAHNVAGIKSLIKTMDDLKLKDVKIYFAAKKDKDVKTELKLLAKNARSIQLVKTDIENMFSPADISKIPSDIKNSIRIKDLKENILNTKKDTIVITGSLYFIGKFLEDYKIT